MKNRRDILLYDGHCGFCGGLVARLRSWDRQGQITFLSSASDDAKPLLEQWYDKADPAQTVILIRDDELLVRSEAVLTLLRELGGWRGFLARLAHFVPRSWRDRIYDLVARNRHRLSSCPIPEESPGADH